jgi:hypothetical protein
MERMHKKYVEELQSRYTAATLSVISIPVLPSITRPQSSLTEGRRYITDGVRLAQRPHRRDSR